MKIASVEAIPLDARLLKPFRFGNVVRTTSSNVIVRITTDDGLVGYGEACPVPQLSGETQESIVAIVSGRVEGLLVGQDPLLRRPLVTAARRRLHGCPFTLAAVDVALLDLSGKALGLSVSELLGGRHRDVIEVHGSVGWDQDPERVADTAEAQARDFRSLKLYAGTGTLNEDLERIEVARERVGDGHRFLLDVNGLWSPLEALSAGGRLRDAGVVMVEQPVAPADLAGQAEVTSVYADRHHIDIVADERVMTVQDVTKVAREGAARCVNVGLSKLGGITAALDAGAAARSASLRVTVGSVVELGIATAAGIHLAAALPELAYPSYLMGFTKYTRQITEPVFEVTTSELAVPVGPGLGIEIDEEAITSMDLRRRDAVRL